MAKLLAIAAKSPDVDVFADSMVAALSSTTLLETASLDEMKLLLEQVPSRPLVRLHGLASMSARILPPLGEDDCMLYWSQFCADWSARIV